MKVNLFRTKLDDATLTELAGHVGIEDLRLNGVDGFTDAGIMALKNLKKLTRLELTNTKITVEGLSALQGNKIAMLAFESDDPAHYRRVGQMFPGLTTFALRGNVNEAALDAVAFAMPNLERLDLKQAKLPDAACTPLGRLKKLAALYVSETDFTDEAMPAIASIKGLRVLYANNTHLTDKGLAIAQGMKSLKHINIKDTETTDAGVASFKKARPDVKVEQAAFPPPY